MLIRLFVLGGLIIALTGREGRPAGDPGGELAIALLKSLVATKCGDGCVFVSRVVGEDR